MTNKAQLEGVAQLKRSLGRAFNHSDLSPQPLLVLLSTEWRTGITLQGTNMYSASTLENASVVSPANERVICEQS